MSTALRICTRGGSTDKPKAVTPGSILIEILLWVFLLIPGVIYSLWRHSARHRVCACCGSKDLIPLSSPRGLIVKQGTVSA
jgi:hypothetical protein